MPRSERAELEHLLSDRSKFLSALATEAQAKRELTESLDCSRSTVNRVLRSLADTELVEYRDGNWHITAVGRAAYQYHDNYIESLGDLVKAEPVVSALPSKTAITESFIAGSTVHTADSVVPDAAIDPMLTSVSEAQTVRGLVPNALAVLGTEFYDAATVGEHEVELVFDESVLDRLSETQLVDLDQAAENPNVTLLRRDISVSFGLWIADDTEAGVTVYSDGGIRGLLLNDTDSAVEWALSLFRTVKDEQLVTPPLG